MMKDFAAYKDVFEISQDGPVLRVALNRPEMHNALNPDMIAGLSKIFDELPGRKDVRVVILTGNGRSFCAGADLAYMRAAADYDFQQNLAGGEKIFDLMRAVDTCPQPVIGRINGAAVGGGVGLVSCCDIVVASQSAKFAFSETRLGLAAAVISPFVVAKIGQGQARELFLTGERFDAQRAAQIGLVGHVIAPDELDQVVAERVQQLLLAAPDAQAVAKELIRTVAYQSREEMRAYTARAIAECRASDEGWEGMSAFLEKRKPSWQNG
jgi:methylglutaconyl-CoA hydratase